MSAGMWHWLAEGDAVTWATAALMLLMSVLSWVVILYKLWFMARARRSVLRNSPSANRSSGEPASSVAVD